jgi:hypothetical protein
MPCTCEGYPAPEPDTHNGPLAEALCKVLQEHEARNEMECFDFPTLKWWEEHKLRDRLRIEKDLREQKELIDRENAIKKLSSYERRLLGIK